MESTRREAHFTPETLLSLLGIRKGALPPTALIPGPKERSQKLLANLENPRKVFSFLDYEVHAGTYQGKKVTVGNGGRYAPDTAITTEILCAGGVESLIRLGSCGALLEGIHVGDLIIVTGAVRGEGTSRYYVPENFSTVAHPDLVRVLVEAAKSLNIRYHLGRVYTTDALFRENREFIDALTEQRIAGIDMVTSAFLTVAQVQNRKAGALLAVSDECWNGKMGFRDPLFLQCEERMMEVGLKAVHLLGS
jgi:uridine phosphorylase